MLLELIFALLQIYSQRTEWKLVWSDEFDGTTIDRSKWDYDIGDGCSIGLCGWGNNELQWYTNRTNNSFVQNGRLVIVALKEECQGKGYTSARMQTKHRGDWKFGLIKVRAKTPRGKGVWPAIWMLPTENTYGNWPKSGEIDMMELRGQEPETVHLTAHFGHLWNDKAQKGVTYTLPNGDFGDDFHEFSIEWKHNSIEWYIDGEKLVTLIPSDTGSYIYPFNHQFHLVLNIAMGGEFGSQPDQTTPLPQRMEIDYVRVYQQRDRW